jgi:hypothetical protein
VGKALFSSAAGAARKRFAKQNLAPSRENLIKRGSKLPIPVRNYFPGGGWQFCSFHGKMGQKNDERGSFL